MYVPMCAFLLVPLELHQMDGWVGGWVGGWMGGWVDGWMDHACMGAWMHGWG